MSKFVNTMRPMKPYGCPYCCAPIGRLHPVHKSDSDFDGVYYICIVCEHTFEPDEYEDLITEE